MKPASCLLLIASSSLAQAIYSEELGEGKPVSPYTDYILPEIVVIGTTPLVSARLPMNKLSGNYQTADSEDIARHESLDITDIMNRSLSSVSTNSVLGNPLQLDVNYRGFTASPILGTPIGISVYQDGVRINNPFGDTVDWDLIPRSAIANIELIPGSNPVYGLNTLGGALSVRTKSGVSHPGTRGQAYGGSFGRKAVEIEHGGSHDNFDWFFTGNLFEEDGFRDFSHSSVKQAFAKVGWENETTDIDLSYTFAENKLTGNGAAPQDMIDQSISSVYAHPETNKPRMNFVNFSLSHLFARDWTLTGNTYYRQNNVGLNAGDVELEADGEGEFAINPVVNITSTNQQGIGGAFQLSYLGKMFSMENQAIWGVSYDSGDTNFNQWRQAAFLTDTRGVLGYGMPEQLTDLKAANHYYGVYMTDTLSVMPWFHVTASGRWNKADINLNGAGRDTDGELEPLNGNHQFNRINPAAGFTLQPLKALEIDNAFKDLTFFANYSEGFRVPTPVELTCADPQAPCALPTNFVSDPPLKPITSQTWEIGFRGTLSQYLNWNIAWFRTALTNDILFINSPGATTRGYFRNVGDTLREGVEIGLRGKFDKLGWYANYSYLDATYQNNVVLQNALGPVTVRVGDHIPSLPPYLVKFGVDYEVLKGWFFGGTLLYNASQYLQGDYNNQFPKVSGYVTVNLNTHYNVSKNVQLYALALNIFDERYQTFGLVNRNAFSNPTGNPSAFVMPGAPLSGWAGVKVTFD